MGSLSSIQHAILVGSLLGDGTLRRQGTRTNALLEVNHAFKYKPYVDWKWQHFQEHILTEPKARIGKGTRIAYRFTTQSLPVFTTYYEWFYQDRKKCIPRDLIIDPQALAVWFMDDGCRIRSAFYLNTQQFTVPEQQYLQKLLLKTFGFTSALNRDKKYWRIRISTKSTQHMRKLIEPYTLECFKYKLTYDPVTTESKDEILAGMSQDKTPRPID